jgi:hypothetical protein
MRCRWGTSRRLESGCLQRAADGRASCRRAVYVASREFSVAVAFALGFGRLAAKGMQVDHALSLQSDREVQLSQDLLFAIHKPLYQSQSIEPTSMH